MELKEKIKKIIELDEKFLKEEKYKIGKTIDEIKGYELGFKFQLKRLKSLINKEKQDAMCKCGHSLFQHSQAHDRCDECSCKKFDCQHINKDIEIDEKRFFCNDCNEWINCEDLKEEKVTGVRCIYCGYEKKYKSKNTQPCYIKSKGHKPNHKFSIKFTK